MPKLRLDAVLRRDSTESKSFGGELLKFGPVSDSGI